ncbi:solute carrier family 35 member F1-like [Phlebotomus argentipes]|uniref:solute carrier family 35 member F1-like n=1 Tax=Phlebotomus argentipes TaxID=94469 RepID=UPI002892F36E|nr:solute carrier family 35 member F1-like [Phlebotomus argentipes]
MKTDECAMDSMEKYLAEYRHWSVWRTILIGQVCSVLCSVLAFFSHHFTVNLHLAIPTGQNYLHYILLCAVFTTWLACRRGDKGLISVAKARGYRYILLGFIDVQANTLLATSYQFTTLVSIQLLDCVALPIALALSCLTLGVRFRFVHIVGVSVCLMGVGCLVWAGVGATKATGDAQQSQLVGDMLCLGGAVLFAVVVVLQELVVKTLDCVEYLGMLGLSGSIICGIQMYLLERNALVDVNWEDKTILIYLAAYGVTQFVFYSLIPYVLRHSGATAIQLYLLTSDFFSLIIGMVLYKFRFHGLYFLNYLLAMSGIYIFTIKKTPIAAQQRAANNNSQSAEERPAPQPPRDYAFETEHFEMTSSIPTYTVSSDSLINSHSATTGFSSFYRK